MIASKIFFGHTEEKISQTSKTNIVEKEEDQIRRIQRQDFVAKVIITKSLTTPCLKVRRTLNADVIGLYDHTKWIMTLLYDQVILFYLTNEK